MFSLFEKARSNIMIATKLEEFSTSDIDTLHGFHIHEKGNLDDNCKGK